MPSASSTKLMSYLRRGAPGTAIVSPVNVTDSSASTAAAASRKPANDATTSDRFLPCARRAASRNASMTPSLSEVGSNAADALRQGARPYPQGSSLDQSSWDGIGPESASIGSIRY